MFEDLIRKLLPNLNSDIKRKLLNDLKDLGRDVVTTKIAEQISRLMVKSLDKVISTAVKHLDVTESEELANAYIMQIDEQLMDLAQALQDYAPHQIAVERAKKRFGNNSPEANDARNTRSKYLQEVRSEVGDLIRAATGEEPKD